jgi:hypothetical protein
MDNVKKKFLISNSTRDTADSFLFRPPYILHSPLSTLHLKRSILYPKPIPKVKPPHEN